MGTDLFQPVISVSVVLWGRLGEGPKVSKHPSLCAAIAFVDSMELGLWRRIVNGEFSFWDGDNMLASIRVEIVDAPEPWERARRHMLMANTAFATCAENGAGAEEVIRHLQKAVDSLSTIPAHAVEPDGPLKLARHVPHRPFGMSPGT